MLEVQYSHVPAEHAIPGLLARDFDVAITERYPHDPHSPAAGIERVATVPDELVLAVPAPYAAASFRELADAPWVMEPVGTAARSWALDRCRSAGFEPGVRFETADLVLHATLIGAGLAVGFIPRLGIRPTLDARLEPSGDHREISISVRRGSRGHPAIDAVTRALGRALEDLTRATGSPGR
ncbi:DNA-binding transcriptional LysR family regulator [Agromyces aurantiacus]|nr:DNA-binding transcriptional LysR family regulator [Agromyces aurantiacus]